MNRVLLIAEDEELIKRLTEFDIWGSQSNYEIACIETSSLEGYNTAQTEYFDAVFVEAGIEDIESEPLIKCLLNEKMVQFVVFVGLKPEFELARKAIRYNAFDYLVCPFQEEQFLELFSRIDYELMSGNNSQTAYVRMAMSYFENKNYDFLDYVKKAVDWMGEKRHFYPHTDQRATGAYKILIESIFKEYSWLELYFNEEKLLDFCSLNMNDFNECKAFFFDNLRVVFLSFCELHCEVNQSQIAAAVDHILRNPESELKQQTIADMTFMNVSVFSTLFKAQTNMYFGVYISSVKLTRAAYLLRNTQLSVNEISDNLYYKDTAYFKRLFKQKYGYSPAQYRKKYEING